MPPRKKAKGPTRAASTPAPDDDPMVIDTPQAGESTKEEPTKPENDFRNDPWTDDQETSLFKGIMKWKPAGKFNCSVKYSFMLIYMEGMHRHFRMIALSEHLRNHGYDPTVEKHTRIPGIWEKLGTLYSLDFINDRENSWEYDEDKDKWVEFSLPEEDYDEATFMRGKRSPSEAPSSPPRLGRLSSPVPATKKRKRADTVTTKHRASTVDDTDEARTSPANSPAPKATRSGRTTNRSAGRVKTDSTSRQQSKDTTATEDEGAETDEADEDDEHDGNEEVGTPSPKNSKAISKAKADPPKTRKSKRKR